MVLASFLFMRKMAETTQITAVTAMFADDESDGDETLDIAIPKDVQIYEIDGPFFFGAAEKFKETIGSIARPPAVLILRMRRVGLLDATGIALIRELAKKGLREGTTLVLSDVPAQPMEAMMRSDVHDIIGEDNFVGDITEALARAQKIIG
jgi:SulP family sulfate permease